MIGKPKEMSESKGHQRESNLSRDMYFSDEYFSLSQLTSFAHQLNHIWMMRPTSVVEVGIGNGFVSTFLKRAGLAVTTVDINPALEPDYCMPLGDAAKVLKKSTDLVVCCEVLEHMPLDELISNLDALRAMGRRLYLTLPNSYRTFGLGGVLSLPKVAALPIDINFDIPFKRKLEGSPHYWEVGSSDECSVQSIKKLLMTRYDSVVTGRFVLNPYHIYFCCE
jgi:hypothetical protein